MEKLLVIKIGGNVIDDEAKLSSFLDDFAGIKEKKILVHGGGKMATRIAEQAGIPQQMVNGRRITDAETLKIIVMVYAGYINKNIVALLQSKNCNAFGLAGADGNAVLAHKRTGSDTDYGFAGDIDKVNSRLLKDLLEQDIVPVLSPITHDQKGSLLNTNADTLAQEIASALSPAFETSLIYCFEKPGVLMNADDDKSVIRNINAETYIDLKNKNIISAGMLPKMENAFNALNKGVRNTRIGKADDLGQLIRGLTGTAINS